MTGKLPYALRTVLCLWLLLFHPPVSAQEIPEMTAPDVYRVAFTDKELNPYSILQPEAFLSARAIERRSRQGIAVVADDLPVSPAYIDSITATGVSILTVSKWFNAVTFKTTDTVALQKIMAYPFVAKTQKVRKSEKQVTSFKTTDNKFLTSEVPILDYGYAWHQTEMLRGNVLHDRGYTGLGIHIAVIDNGFYLVDELEAFSALRAGGQILGTRDFVNASSDIYNEAGHGMRVLSVMGGNLPGMLSGTATEASYWLLRSEDSGSEYLVEEDNWIAAAEFADSAGVDIINTSLGYTRFDDPLQDHEYADMDGRTARVSTAAEMAASRGMLVVISAGNQGESDWGYISAPADAHGILAVGAVDPSGKLAAFSGRGPSSDGRIKPDVMALGWGTYHIGADGDVWQGSGTSLAAPLITGLAACLWQAYPEVTSSKVRTAILQSASQYTAPDSLYGYGIPDFAMASVLLGVMEGIPEEGDGIAVFPNPVKDDLYLLFDVAIQSDVEMKLIDARGSVVWQGVYAGYEGQHCIRLSKGMQFMDGGMYFLQVISGELAGTVKIIKN